nr:MAG TPA: hypothetical protein [Caudoviricetes sp.]
MRCSLHQFSGFRDRGLSAPQSAHVRQLFSFP